MVQTLFQRLGGQDVILKMTHYLYVNVLRDEKLKPFFEDINVETQTHKMQVFLSTIFGDKATYNAEHLRDAHKHLVANGLNDSHIDAMIECVCCTLKEMDIDNNITGEVCQRINRYRDDVLGR